MKQNHRLTNRLAALGLAIATAVTIFFSRTALGQFTNPPPCCAKEPKTSHTLSNTSLYQIDSTWTNDSGKAVRLASLAGRPQVVTMFFSNCQYACPLLVHDMKKIEAALPAGLRSRVGFALVSFDSERDTRATLAKFRTSRALPESWTLLTAKPDDISELAMLLGVKFKKGADGQFAHSNVITVLDAKGQIVFQQNGLNKDATEVAAVLKRLLAAH
jgi:protein SCO1/2